MVVAPPGSGVFRVGASVPHDHDGDDVPREFFQKLLDERVPGGLRLGHMNFSGVFTATSVPPRATARTGSSTPATRRTP